MTNRGPRDGSSCRAHASVARFALESRLEG